MHHDFREQFSSVTGEEDLRKTQDEERESSK